MNAVIRTIQNRRSCRRYKPEQLSNAILDAILQAGRHAPSGGNTQSCHFVVIQNVPLLGALKQRATESFSAMEVTEGMYKSLANAIQRSKRGAYDFCAGAPTLVVVTNLRSYPNAMASSACALENMMLAATSLDVGSCWINQLHWLDDDPSIRALLCGYIGSDETICGSLALGYPSGVAASPLALTGNRISYIR